MEFYNTISSILPFERTILSFFDNDEILKLESRTVLMFLQ